MPVEGRGDHRSRSMPRSYPYAVSDPAQDECFGIHGISEGEEQPDKDKVTTVGKNAKAIKEYIATQLKQDKESSQMSIDDLDDPFTGNK